MMTQEEYDAATEILTARASNDDDNDDELCAAIASVLGELDDQLTQNSYLSQRLLPFVRTVSGAVEMLRT